MSWSHISTYLEGNFPEYSSLRAGDIEEIYDKVEELHPGWLGEMHGAESNSTEIQELLTLVQSHGFGRGDRFPRDTRSMGAMLAYIHQLVNDTPEMQHAAAGSNEIDPEFLRALPADIQQELLHGRVE